MTAVPGAAPAPGALAASRASRACCACRAVLAPGESEPVPSRPWLVRCRDEDACRRRYTPRRLARSVRGQP